MSPLSDEQVVALWERARNRRPLARALLLLEEARPDLDKTAGATLSIAERDRSLLHWRREAIGRKLPVQIVCPACEAELEFEIDTAEIAGTAPVAEVATPCGLRFRLPTSADLTALSPAIDVDAAARELARRCCLEPDAEITDVTVVAAETAMAAAHRAAAVGLSLECSACGHRWSDSFDIAAYLWSEIEQRVTGLFDEVHWLAACYGWSEAAVLAMSPARRAAYLERCGA